MLFSPVSECATCPQGTKQEQAHFVIASPAGAKQSLGTIEKIASSGKTRPPRDDIAGL